MFECLKCRIKHSALDASYSPEYIEGWGICIKCKPVCIDEILRKYPKILEVSDSAEYLTQTFESYVHNLFYRKVICKGYERNRREYLKLLRNTISQKEIEEIRKTSTCPITGDCSDLTMDHFIPLNWGHGGNYKGNIIFLSRKINSSKSNKNPFKWYRKISRLYEVDEDMWKQMITNLVIENGFSSTKEFKDFVNWCEKHKRSLDQLKVDNRDSLVLWKELCF